MWYFQAFTEGRSITFFLQNILIKFNRVTDRWQQFDNDIVSIV